MVKRTKQMTDAECFKALLKRDKAERVVYMEYYGFPVAPIYSGKSLYDAYIDLSFSYGSQKQMAKDIGWIFQPVYPSLGGEFGGEIRLPVSIYAQSMSIIRHPVETEEAAWKLTVPEALTIPSVKRGHDFCRLSSGEQLVNEVFNVTLCVTGPFTLAGKTCGVERLCRWILKKPEVVHHVLRLTTDYLISQASLWMKTFKGSDIVYFPSEPTASNNIISPKHFEEFVLPYNQELHRKVIDLGYRHILCHICGNQTANLPHWSKIPMGDPGIVSISPEIDIETAAGYFPHDIIYGNLDPILLQTGTPEQVYRAAGRVIRAGKKLGNRYTFGQGCEIPPLAKTENIRAMIRAVDEFGWY